MAETIQTVGPLAGICGHDGTNWEKVLIDASKRLVVAVASLVAADVQMHGYYSGSWQKSPLPWGYSDTVQGVKSNTNLAAGANWLYGDTVPAGEVWVLSSLVAMEVSATINRLSIFAIIDAATILVNNQQPPTSGAWYVQTGQFVLGPGDKPAAYVVNATAGDDLSLTYCGYKVDLDL